MFCWNCGHENPDSQKFCGECGKSLFKPEKVVRGINHSGTFVNRPKEVISSALADRSSDPVAPAPAKPVQSNVSQRAPEPPKPTNPLIEEPRVLHEKPISAATTQTPTTQMSSATYSRDRAPNRITGPSFLGLSDEGPSRNYESSYLLEDEEPSSPWRGYLFLTVLVVAGLLVIRDWQDVRVVAADYAQRLGITDAPKHSAGPERVTASNDASKLTPDAAAEEGKSTTPSEDKAANDAAKPQQGAPQQMAKLEKPQSDNETDKNDAPSGEESASSRSAEPSAVKLAPAPVDNSQLEEAQKYLQGRGVPQDCNRGVSLLRSAAKQENPKARIQMAALYASGHCVTENLAEAYTWFSRAQELEPHNRMIERNLDSLWARMSDDERRKVLR